MLIKYPKINLLLLLLIGSLFAEIRCLNNCPSTFNTFTNATITLIANSNFNDINLDSSNFLYVTDRVNNVIYKLDSDGNIILNISSNGTGPAQILYPGGTSIGPIDQNVYVGSE
jgi:hypothetical protein